MEAVVRLFSIEGGGEKNLAMRDRIFIKDLSARTVLGTVIKGEEQSYETYLHPQAGKIDI